MNEPDTHAKQEVRFVFKADPGSRVYVVGSFNRWDPEKNPLAGPDELGNYSITLLLPEGHYEYLFVIDGSWRPDPMNPHRVDNQYGASNSVIDVVYCLGSLFCPREPPSGEPSNLPKNN